MILHFNAAFIKDITKKKSLKSLWLPIGRGGVDFIVHLITWLKTLRFKIPFPTPVGMLDIVFWPKSKPKSKLLHTNMPLLLQLNVFLAGLSWRCGVVLLFLSTPKASDVTEDLSNIMSDVLPSLEPLPGNPGMCSLVAWGSVSPPSHYWTFVVTGSQSEPDVQAQSWLWASVLSNKHQNPLEKLGMMENGHCRERPLSITERKYCN